MLPLDRVLHAFWLKGGPMPPGFAKGGHFEVKEGHPERLQSDLKNLPKVKILKFYF